MLRHYRTLTPASPVHYYSALYNYPIVKNNQQHAHREMLKTFAYLAKADGEGILIRSFMGNDADDFELLYKRDPEAARRVGSVTNTAFGWRNLSFMSQVKLPDGHVKSFPTMVYEIIGGAVSEREAVERLFDYLNNNMKHFPGDSEDFADFYRPYSPSPYSPEPGYVLLVGEAGSPSATGLTTSALRSMGLKAEQFFSPKKGFRVGSVQIDGSRRFYEGNSLGLDRYTKGMPACALIRTTLDQVESHEYDNSCVPSWPGNPAGTGGTLDGGPVSPDRAILVALYHATGGANWTNNANWLSDRPVGEWYGVTAFNARVIRLNLSYNGLTGQIPPELGNLTYSIGLYLSVNGLTGQIPPELGNLRYLATLGLSWNQLAGEIPSELGNLHNLTVLSLSSNQLTGQVPSELGNLPYLNRLSLRENRLTGCLPAALKSGLSRLAPEPELPFCEQ